MDEVTAVHSEVHTIMSSGPPLGIDLNADIKNTVISPVIALMIIAAGSVALRVVARVSSKLALQIEDYFIFAALVGVSMDLGVFVATV